jgi:hypothetical protein
MRSDLTPKFAVTATRLVKIAAMLARRVNLGMCWRELTRIELNSSQGTSNAHHFDACGGKFRLLRFLKYNL